MDYCPYKQKRAERFITCALKADPGKHGIKRRAPGNLCIIFNSKKSVIFALYQSINLSFFTSSLNHEHYARDIILCNLSANIA